MRTERLEQLTRYVEEGVLTPRLVASYRLDEVADAFERKAAGGVHGKLGITVH